MELLGEPEPFSGHSMPVKPEKQGMAQLRAFIVDDNENMRSLLRKLLTAIDMRMLFEYSDGQAALADLPLVHPDLILTDLSMAPMDGVAFAQAVRRNPDPHVSVLPIIMVTGHTERRRVEAARDAGINELLAKPVTAANLLHRIEEIILRPRPYVRSPAYFGPCRRRHKNPDYPGPFRRATDAPARAGKGAAAAAN
jgi:CheY-like chemotaxis protein